MKNKGEMGDKTNIHKHDATSLCREVERMVSNSIVKDHPIAEKKYALLIDGDNISGDYAKLIVDEASQLGMVTIRFVYGNWMDNSLMKWKNAISDYSMTPRQQLPNIAGKNATDSALIIEAMDILYREEVDGFIIASSDSDYTALAKRLRQSGKPVIGMGRKQTHSSFRNSCTQFIILDIDDPEGIDNKVESATDRADVTEESGNGLPDEKEIKASIDRLLDESEGEGSTIIVSEITDKLRNRYPDFSPKNYGHKKMSRLLSDWGYQVIAANSNSYVVCPTETSSTASDTGAEQDLSENVLRGEIQVIMNNSRSEKVILSTIKDQLVKKYPSFKIKDYKCKTMAELVKKLGFEIISDDSNKYIKRN